MNKNSDDYNEYSTLSKYCSNCYIFIILLISLIHSINPKLICKMISHNLGILVCDKGKIIINLSLGILYLNNKNTPITSRVIGSEYLLIVWNLIGVEK